MLPKHGGLSAVAGTASQLSVIAIDADGIGLAMGGTVVTARVFGGPATVPAIVMDQGNGTVAVRFALKVQGVYQVQATPLHRLMTLS